MSELTSALIDRRTGLWDKQKALAGLEAVEGRPLTPDENRQYEELGAEVEHLDKRIEAIFEGEKRAQASRETFAKLSGRPQLPGRRPSGIQDDDLNEQFRRQIVDKYPNGIDIEPTRRRFYSQPGLEYRVLTKATATQALPTDVYDHVVMHMVENSAVMAAGATVLNTATGDALQIPKSTAFIAAPLTAEGVAPAGGDAVVGVTTLNAYKFMGFFQVSRELADDSESDILGFLAAQVGTALALSYGPNLITGTGTGQPNGVVTAAGVGVTGPVGTTVGLGTQGTAGMGTDLGYSMIGSVAEPYARSAAAGWLMTNASLQIFRKLKDTTGQPVAAATMRGGSTGAVAGMPAVNELLGYPVHIDPFVAQMAASAKSLIFGDWSRYFIRIAGPIRFERSDEFAFSTDLISFRAIIRLDGNLVDANGIKVFANSAT